VAYCQFHPYLCTGGRNVTFCLGSTEVDLRSSDIWLPWWWAPIIGHLFDEDGYGWFFGPKCQTIWQTTSGEEWSMGWFVSCLFLLISSISPFFLVDPTLPGAACAQDGLIVNIGPLDRTKIGQMAGPAPKLAQDSFWTSCRRRPGTSPKSSTTPKRPRNIGFMGYIIYLYIYMGMMPSQCGTPYQPTRRKRDDRYSSPWLGSASPTLVVPS
jgi:hypothetical protein